MPARKSSTCAPVDDRRRLAMIRLGALAVNTKPGGVSSRQRA